MIELVSAMSDRLGEVFGPKIKVYVSGAARGAGEACFLLTLLPPASGERGRASAIKLLYFPADGGEGWELLAVAERLMERLYTLTLWDGSLLRASKRRYEILDGTLHFFVHYRPLRPMRGLGTALPFKKGSALKS